MRKRKMTALLLTAAMAGCALLSGCQEKNTQPENTQAETLRGGAKRV